MKHVMLWISCILCSITLQAKEKTTVQPQFLAWSSTSIEIDKVVQSDTATVLHIKAFYRPHNWIRIDAKTYLRVGGEKLLIRAGDGIELSKEFWMPDSGEASFKLIFPPLPKNTKSFDFIESDCEDCFKIWGVQLEGKLPPLQLDEKISGQKIDYNAPIPTPKTEKGMALLSGKLIGFQPGMSNKAKIYAPSLLSDKEIEVEVNIEPDGTFKVEVPLYNTTSAFFLSPFYRGAMILSPGESCDLMINLREISRSQSRLHKDEPAQGKQVYFGGAYAAFNDQFSDPAYYVSDFINSEEEYNAYLSVINGLTLVEVKAYLLGQYQKTLDLIHANTTQSADMKMFRTIELQQKYIHYINGASQYQATAYRKANNLERTAPVPEGIISEPDAAYFDYLKDFTLNSPLCLLSQNYKYTVGGLSNLPVWKVNGTPKQKLTALLGTDSGILFDLLDALPYAGQVDDFNLLTDAQIAEVKTLPNAAFTDLILSLNDSVKASIEINKLKTGYTENEMPAVSNEELFDAIISKYKGKVIFVDFWATWCGPCRQAMTQAEPVKAALAGKEIVYLYLAGENSPLGAWKNAIPDIHGQHYRMTDAQWDFLCSKFKVNGVPSYMIVGKDGKQAHFQVGFMGAEKMKSMLLAEIEK